MGLKVFVAALFAYCAICGVKAQTTLTGCHLHEGVEYCYLPDGQETRIGTPTGSLAAAIPSRTSVASVSVSSTTSPTATGQTTAVTDCHVHEATPICINGVGEEVQVVVPTPTGSDTLPTSYNNCHAHGAEMFCEDAYGKEVEIRSVAADAGHDGHDDEEGGHEKDGHEGHDHEEEGGHNDSDAAPSVTAVGQTTAITSCHIHEATPMCINGAGEEVQVVVPTPTGSETLPTAYTGCHAHGSEMFCKDAAGAEVQVLSTKATAGEDDHSGHGHDEAESGEQSCHFHAGVEHCTGGSKQQTCSRNDRDYNIKLRIGLLFVMLVGSGLAVYLPLFLSRVLHMDTSGLVFTLIKQFGTGVIIATAFVHLLTHANLMFSNECLPPLKYEATTTAIAMAGAFIAFLIEYLGHRLAGWRRGVLSSRPTPVDNNTPSHSSSDLGHTHAHEPSKEAHEHTHAHDHAIGSSGAGLAGLSHHHHAEPDSDACSIAPQDKFSVLVLEAGIIFHSILLGITLVVAGDSVFITLYVVILFHQMFEGLALGARIAALSPDPAHANHKHLLSWDKVKNLVLPGLFACITPIGMAIGIGVLKSFNGNDPNTIIALGTLDAVSAGILMWVGLVGMWAHDWMFGELRDAKWTKVVPAGMALVVGMILMGVLGKWA